MSVARARSLRQRMPPAEARMWVLLRTEPFRPYHFRRQVQIGPFNVDFASHAARMVIEIDGDSHFSNAAEVADLSREAHIRAEGYDVIRFTNRDVMWNLDGVSRAVTDRITPTRPGFAGTSSPQGGGRRQNRSAESVDHLKGGSDAR